MIPPVLLSASEAVLPALGNHLWQSTLFAAAAWLLTLVLRRNQARVRHWLWLAASAKFLIPFSRLVGLGGRLAWSHPAMGSEAGMYTAIDQASQPFSRIPGLTPAISAAQPAAVHSFTTLWPVLLALAWLCGSLAVLAVWVVQYRRIARVMREAKALRVGREAKTLRRLEERAGIRRQIETLSSSASLEPGVFGVFRPVLLWPEGISRRLDDAQLEAVLAHELCHVQRRDNLTSMLHMLVEALFWFHPLVWWMEGRLVAERERACDEAVLRLGKQPQTYAEGILKVCEFCVAPPLRCVSGVTGADLKERIARIMAERLGDRLTRGRKLLLASAGAAAIAAPILFGQTKAAPSAVEPQASYAVGNAPTYGVVSIKLNKSNSGPWGLTPKPDGFNATDVTLLTLIRDAYGFLKFTDDRISGAPNWAKTDKYDIAAKVDTSDVAAVPKFSRDQRELMLQSLLADRFKLKIHVETKELPVYALVVAKNGPKFNEAKPGDTYPNGIKLSDGSSRAGLMRLGHGLVIGQAISMATLANMLTQQHPGLGNRVVLDKTGLTGKYDVTLKWTPDESQASPGAGSAALPADSGPSIFTAIQEQLGLKLESAKGPVQVLVIDSVERPSPN